MRTKVKFRDGFVKEIIPNDNYHSILGDIGVDLDEVPELRQALTREEIVKCIFQTGKADSVIDGMYSIEGESKLLSCKYLISIGPATDVKYEDVVNSGYTFKYFSLSDGSVYVLFSSVEDL